MKARKACFWSKCVSDIGWRLDSQTTFVNDGFVLVWQLNLENESVKLGREKGKIGRISFEDQKKKENADEI